MKGITWAPVLRSCLPGSACFALLAHSHNLLALIDKKSKRGKPISPGSCPVSAHVVNTTPMKAFALAAGLATMLTAAIPKTAHAIDIEPVIVRNSRTYDTARYGPGYVL